MLTRKQSGNGCERKAARGVVGEMTCARALLAHTRPLILALEVTNIFLSVAHFHHRFHRYFSPPAH
jgi:hypothetical protein